MLSDFFVRAILAGVGIAIVAGPLGCFVVWRKMAFFGDTLAHSALLGIALGLLLDLEPALAIFVVCSVLALGLFYLQNSATTNFSNDALLGILSHSSLALGLIALSLLTWINVNLESLLFGDILAVSKTDLIVIAVVDLGILAIIATNWNLIVAATLSRDLTLAEGGSPQKADLLLILMLAGLIAIAMKIVGALLITALLIIPTAAARRISGTPEMMAIYAALAGMVSVIAGLYASLEWDSPPGPSIVVAAMVLFFVSLIGHRRWPITK